MNVCRVIINKFDRTYLTKLEKNVGVDGQVEMCKCAEKKESEEVLLDLNLS